MVCRVYGSGAGQYTRLCYRTGRRGQRVPGDVLHGRKHYYPPGERGAPKAPPKPPVRTALGEPVERWRCACGAPMSRHATECEGCRIEGQSARRRDVADGLPLVSVVIRVPRDWIDEVDRIAEAEGMTEPVVWRAVIGAGLVEVARAQADGAGRVTMTARTDGQHEPDARHAT